MFRPPVQRNKLEFDCRLYTIPACPGRTLSECESCSQGQLQEALALIFVFHTSRGTNKFAASSLYDQKSNTLTEVHNHLSARHATNYTCKFVVRTTLYCSYDSLFVFGILAPPKLDNPELRLQACPPTIPPPHHPILVPKWNQLG